MSAIAEPIIYERHQSGGGRRERTVTCADSVYLDAETLVEGGCSLTGDAQIRRSRLMGFCRISGNVEIHGSLLDGRITVSDHVEMFDCQIVTSQQIVGNEFQWGEVLISDFSQLGQVRIDAPPTSRVGISGNAKLGNVDIRGNCHIENAEVYDCEIPDSAWIAGGVWHRAPRVVKTGTFFDITESHNEGSIFIGCMERPIAAWVRGAKILAEQYGLSEQEFAIYRDAVLPWDK